jgi:hypothetical protein
MKTDLTPRPARVRSLTICRLTLFVFFAAAISFIPALAQDKPITRQEMLRGTITPERVWWDVQHYVLSVQFMPETRSIKGSNVISFKTLKPGSRMQIDLQQPLNITKVVHDGTDLKFEREGNVFWITFDKEIPQGVEDKVAIYYEGKPKAATNPPGTAALPGGTTISAIGTSTLHARASARASGGQTKTSAMTNRTTE